MTDISEILPSITLDRLVPVLAVIHHTLGVRVIFFLRYRLVKQRTIGNVTVVLRPRSFIAQTHSWFGVTYKL